MTLEFRAHMQTLFDADTKRCFEEMQDEITRAVRLPRGTDFTLTNSVITTHTVAANPAMKALTFESLKAMMDKLEPVRKQNMDGFKSMLGRLEGSGFQKGVPATFPSVTSPASRKSMVDATDAIRHAGEQMALGMHNMLLGLRVIETPNLPTRHIGHWFNEVPPSKNRSKRLWKKLRYGTRARSHVRQMREEIVMMTGPGDMLVSPATAKQLALLTQPVKE